LDEICDFGQTKNDVLDGLFVVSLCMVQNATSAMR